MSIRQHNVSVASSWRGLLLWYHNVTTLRLTHSRPQECPHSPYLSLFWAKLFFLLFLLVSLSFCMSFSLSFYPFLACASIAFPLVPFLGCMLIGREGGDLGAVHTDMTICHWHTGQCKQWEQCMWQNEKVRGGGSEAPPLPTYTWDFTYDYIHKTLLPWQQVFSYLGTRPFQCRNSSLKSLPALPCF